jgi:hypothetical protein
VTTAIAAVIPTRDRADLAIAAVRSLLDQNCPIEIFLSDNSVSGERLREYARSEPRVHYLRPEHELRMAEHWDWAMRQAMERSPATHFALHYDRKYSKPRRWQALAAVIARRPDMLVTYLVDTISDEPPPLRLWQSRWTGRTWLLETARIAALVASGRVGDADQAIPILTNCVVPRAVLESIVDRFGDLCNSTSGDACFCSRFLALHDRFLHFDRPLAVLYAPHRSAALGFLSGGGRDYRDWERMWGDRPWLEAAPVPGLDLGQNMLFHEYELVRRRTGDRLPPLDRKGCLAELGEALRWVKEPEKRAALQKALEVHGWTGTASQFPRRPRLAALRDSSVKALMRYFGFVPKSISGFAFADDAAALDHALKYERRPAGAPDHLAALGPIELASS